MFGKYARLSILGIVTSCFWGDQASATDVCARYTDGWQRARCLEDVGTWECSDSDTQKAMSTCFVELLRAFEEKYRIRLRAVKPGCFGMEDYFFDGRTRLSGCLIYNVEAGDPGMECVRVSASNLRCCDVAELDDKNGKRRSRESFQKAFCKNVSCELGSRNCFGVYTKVKFKPSTIPRPSD
jgi:hypothetical protein